MPGRIFYRVFVYWGIASLFAFLLFPPRLTASAQDSISANISRLDSCIQLNPDNPGLLLERGREHLQAGQFREARDDFNAARASDSSGIIAQARLGLGDSYRAQPNRKWRAIREYRLAIKADSSYRSKALYEIARTAFELGWTHGYNVATDALTELVSLDPEYKNVLKIWWEKIFTQSDDELLDVCRRLEELIDQGNDNLDLLIYSARIRFRLDQPDSVMVSLAKLKAASPEHRRSERLLLEAKCRLEFEDTLGFERSYNESLRYAEQEDDFIHLFRETEPICNPTEAAKWDSLKTAAEKAAFFHTFWKRRDPDPTTPHNERLLTHYMRLHEARKKYWEYTPHSLFNTSYTYYRLMASRPVYSFDNPYFDSEYDPDIWWDNCRPLALQQRGLFYIRHGEPDMLYRFGLPWDAGMKAPSYEAWRYNNSYFLFGRDKGFYAASKSYAEQGDITAAMNSESYKDPLPFLRMANYRVDFKSRDGKLEAEFYQSLPVSLDTLPLDARQATVVIYDNRWRELERRDVVPQKVFTGRDSMWIAVNRVPVEPGLLFCALRIDVPGYRAVVRRALEPLPYSGDELELSGLVLGSPPPEGVNVHSRGGIDLLPRPSLAFRHGELITVYLEIYGLRAGSDGRRSFGEQVTVTLEEQAGDKNIIKRLFGRKKPRTSLTLQFDRYPQETGSQVAEHFAVDTSELVPGRYGLTLRVKDKHDGHQAAVAIKFNLLE